MKGRDFEDITTFALFAQNVRQGTTSTGNYLVSLDTGIASLISSSKKFETNIQRQAIPL